MGAAAIVPSGVPLSCTATALSEISYSLVTVAPGAFARSHRLNSFRPAFNWARYDLTALLLKSIYFPFACAVRASRKKVEGSCRPPKAGTTRHLVEHSQSPWATASAKATSPVSRSSLASASVPNTRARLSSNSPSQRPTTAVARQLPITFTHVRPISINSSTPNMTATPIGPSPDGTNELSARSRMTNDARGTPATPFDVSINVNIIVICCPSDMCQPIVVSAACATNTDAIAKYNVDPVRLNE